MLIFSLFAVFDVLSQFAMLYMLLSLSLGWTLGTSYKNTHLQMISKKPASKVVGLLAMLQVSSCCNVYMLLSLSLGWTLGTSYKNTHLQMISKKPASKVVGLLAVLQVRPIFKIFLFPLTRPCFTNMGW